MKKVFIVEFMDAVSGKWYPDSVWESEENAKSYVNRRNEWEKSENGDGDFWYYARIAYHEK